MSHNTSPDFSKRGGVGPDQRLAERSRQHALFEGVHKHLLILARQADYLCSKSIQIVLEGLSLMLPYIEQVIRHHRWRLVHNVLVDKKLRELLETSYVASRQADEPFQRCSMERAHNILQ